jgi:cell division topological specificity factor
MKLRLFSKKRESGMIAGERLRLLFQAEKKQLSEDTMQQLVQEIGTVITKYIDVDPEHIEVRVTLKDYC